MLAFRAMGATASTTRSWPGARSHKQEGQDPDRTCTWPPVPKGSMAQPHLHAVMPETSERGRRRRRCTASTNGAGGMAPWPNVGAALKAWVVFQKLF